MMYAIRTSLLALSLAFGAGLYPAPAGNPKPATENIFFVMPDGLRWQEVFSGADRALLNKERGGVTDIAAMEALFWRDDPAKRREALMPFTWKVIAKQGQLFGNRLMGSSARVTNGLNFSYPGYNEVLCGYADARINSNGKRPNPNVSVLEWLGHKPGFKGRIAAFTSWDVFPYILNVQRSGLMVSAGNVPLDGLPETPDIRLLNRLLKETSLYAEETRPDALTFHAALTYLRLKKPRVLFLCFDETDAQGHAGRYDRLLVSAHKIDGYVRELWETAQSMPQYRGKTTLIFVPDHGRGDAPSGWKSHGANIKGSEHIWMGFLGPDTPPLGERANVPELTQDRIAATLAMFLGEDYRAAIPRAGKPIAEVYRTKKQ